MTGTMRAAVVERPGGPEVLEVREVSRPEARPGWSLVRVKGFGLNRSELMTRQGHSPNVRFPRILGIECVGVLEDPSDSGLAAGTAVAAVMGGMGREFDGGYAEFALVPNQLLITLDTDLDWAVLAALPETYLTAYGSLRALGVHTDNGEAKRTLLVRGGTSSVGIAALSLASGYQLETIATTRNPPRWTRCAPRAPTTSWSMPVTWPDRCGRFVRKGRTTCSTWSERTPWSTRWHWPRRVGRSA
jgi:NADPH:quinone reductase-like Zn-dependent oxidoreductase